MITGRTPILLLILTLSLIVVGLTVVYSASSNKAGAAHRIALKDSDPVAYANSHDYHSTKFLVQQATYAALGIAIMLFLSNFDHHAFRKLSIWLLLLTLVLLGLVFVPGIGARVNGANRWIRVLGFTFQPSELAKLVMIIYMARLLLDRQRDIESFRRGLLPALFVTGFFCFVIVIEPDFGAAAILGMIVFGLWFIAGMRVWHIVGLCIAVVPLGVYGIVSSPYRLKRIKDWLALLSQGVQDDQQISQSVIAIGSGGLHGLGLGNSIQKYAFLPELHTDFIFAILGEEMGFIRSALVVLAFLGLITLGWRVALKASDSFGGYLAAGITLMLALSVTFNLLVVLGFFPPKGLALPFLSYGGSSLLVNCAAMGILINVAKYNEQAAPVAPRRKRRL